MPRVKSNRLKKTTVYMIDYQPITGGKEVKNHKWVVDDELSKP
ncbi:DUF1541 domain-containing protein [Virgibacillus halophilus]|uniref:DUF1541 domain-containing protein n=1 Tax=Tigheibacillus halophilus TaxID=361280 RepID=A0ABU5C7G8_9BACI|nr:DUF1541 domain-containing protein [Virgibacillus halophilus]